MHHGVMADRDKDKDMDMDIDKLLAEVEGVVGGKPASAPPPRGDRPAEPVAAGLTARARTAVASATVAAAVVWVVFALVPFLGATSGAAGAFLATLVTVLVAPRRRTRRR